MLRCLGLRTRGLSRGLCGSLRLYSIESSQDSDTYTVTKSRLRPRSRDLIILGAKSSRLLPRLKRPDTRHNTEIKVEVLDEQRKQLMVFESDASEESILQSIVYMKPLNDTVSAKRYDQLRLDLIRAYSVNQLRQFCTQNLVLIPNTTAAALRRTPKSRLATIIMNQVWGLQPSSDISEDTDLIIEKTIQLNRRDLFLIVSRNGHMPRSWTKSGAKVVILGDEQKIVIRSTAQTYDWILASLHKALQRTKTATVMVPPAVDWAQLPLGRIQILSNAYVEPQDSGNMLVTAMSSLDIEHARRMVLYAANALLQSGDHYLYQSDLIPKDYCMARVVEEESMDWNERAKGWFRIQTIKNRDARPSNNTKAPDSIIKELTQSISQSLEACVGTEGPSETQITVAVTFGHLLHDTNDLTTAVSGRARERTFSTNIPAVAERTGSLPFYNLDIANETNEDTDSPMSSSDDLWKELLRQPSVPSERSLPSLHSDLEPTRVRITKSKDGFDIDNFVYMAQLKFVPSPEQDGFEQYPPVEMWLEIDSATDKCVLDSTMLVATDYETSTYAALPAAPADLKVTVSRSTSLDHTTSAVQAFLGQCNLDFSGRSRISIPESMEVTMSDGTQVTYAYQTLFHRRQTEHAYKQHIMQLSTIEGGGFSGRRVETTMVLDYSTKTAEKIEEDVPELVGDASAFAHKLLKR